MKSEIGLIGIGVMGENLALNMEDKGFVVSIFDNATAKLEKFISGRGQGKNIQACHSVQALINSLELPRKIMLMVPAGQAIDDVIQALLPFLEKGDIVIDGGNSNFPDTTRRVGMLENRGFLFVGVGVSGGEEGALLGPSLMPGGSSAAWVSVKPVFQAIAAKVDGVACCEWIGEEGAGHFVKMVHNGIEYGDMQLICEIYDVMRKLLGMTAAQMHEVFKYWSESELKSYLIEITRDILAVEDEDGLPLLDRILDRAGQKGTGKWAVTSALELAVPLTLITESVFARVLSAMKEERVVASTLLPGPIAEFSGNKRAFVDQLGKALYAAKIISYAQGYQLMQAAGRAFSWNLNYGGIASIWRGGCIIRSVFLGRIQEAFERKPDLDNLLLDRFFQESMASSQQGLRDVLTQAVSNGIPVPTLSSALAYYDGYRCANLPANLLQAQRDFFGAHQYERTDKPRGMYFHTNWTGRGGDWLTTITLAG